VQVGPGGSLTLEGESVAGFNPRGNADVEVVAIDGQRQHTSECGRQEWTVTSEVAGFLGSGAAPTAAGPSRPAHVHPGTAEQLTDEVLGLAGSIPSAPGKPPPPQ